MEYSRYVALHVLFFKTHKQYKDDDVANAFVCRNIKRMHKDTKGRKGKQSKNQQTPASN